MFDIAPSEFLLVAVVALVVIGPKDLPKALRVVGYWVGRARGVARQFRAGFDEMVREAELAEMEKKWAAENERIMREHGSGDASEAAAPARLAPTVGEEVEAPSSDGVVLPAEAAPAEPPPPPQLDIAEQAMAHAAMRESRVRRPPLSVEHPHVEPAAEAAAPADPAAS